MPIALLTDFGTKDYFVGAMKGTILSINPNAVVVDITHEVPPRDIASAAFTLAACFKDFPSGTIFVAVVDPGVGSDRRGLLVEAHKRFFVSPDNGLLSIAIDEEDAYRAFRVTNPDYFRRPASPTFHGRDIFAPVAAYLSRGIEPCEFGTPISDMVRLPVPVPRSNEDGNIEGEILHIDRFGNLVTNIRSDDLPARFAITLGSRTINRQVRFFAEGNPGELVAIAGSAGYIEICVNGDSAERILDAQTGQQIFVSLVSQTPLR